MTAPLSAAPFHTALASYVPQMVRRAIAANPSLLSKPWSERFAGAVLFADISGFTRVSEILTNSHNDGVEQVSMLLNRYFGQLIDIVVAHGGDVVAFTGDGVIALWSPPLHPDLTMATLRAAQCSLAIQRKLDNYPATEQIQLSLRVAVGAGELLLACVGGVLGRWEVLLAGPPLQQVSIVETQMHPGSVVLAPAAWELVAGYCQGTTLGDMGVQLHAIDVPPLLQPSPYIHITSQMIPALGAFLPGAILDRLEAGLSDWLAELRYVTVLFVNVSGLDYAAPEIVDRLQLVLQTLQKSLYQYEASVNQFVVDDKGTTLIAALGLPPLVHTDAAIRAVRAAIAMQVRLRPLAAELNCVVGITTGWVFCGARGNEQRRDYAMIGDPVNLAARLMQAAGEHNGLQPPILCDQTTYEAARERLLFEELPAITFKGRTEPVAVYHALGREQPRDPLSERPLVGRGPERQLLAERLELLQQVGHSAVVVIEGETGLGKSRLLSDLNSQARQQGLPVLLGQGDTATETTSYQAWRPIFADLFELDLIEEHNQLSQRIRVLNRLWIYPELARLAPLINAVLPLDIPENRITLQMSGQLRADNTRRLLVGVLQSLLAALPTTLVIDDAHWLDSASWELLLAVAQHVEPLLIVIALQPPPPPILRTLLTLPTAEQLTLDSLTPEQTLHLVGQRLKVDHLAPEVANLVLARGQCNPLYTEELVSAMWDEGLLQIEDDTCTAAPNVGDLSTISVPTSVQGVIVSRIDRLPPASQLALKVASVIGQSFTLAALQATYPLVAERPLLPGYLQQLVERDMLLLQPATTSLPPTYVFKHVIVWEVAYNLLLFAQRRKLHHTVARWYEQTYVDDLVPHHGLLAHHWYLAAGYLKAIDYLELAGERALDSFAIAETIRAFEAIRTIVRDHNPLPKTPQTYVRQAHWERLLGEAFFRQGNLIRARQHLEQAVHFLRRPLPTARRTLTLRTIWELLRQTRHWLRDEPATPAGLNPQAPLLEAVRTYEQLIPIYYLSSELLPAISASLLTLNLAERLGVSAELARAYANMCMTTGSFALHQLAEAYAQRALTTADQLGGLETQAYVRSNIGLYRLGLTHWSAARLPLEEALDICEQIDDRRQWGLNWTLLGQIAYYEGDFARVVEMAETLYREASAANDLLQQAWALGGQGEGLLRLGIVERACQLFEEANTLLAKGAELPSQISNYGLLAQAYLRRGQLDKATAAARAAEQLLMTIPIPIAYYLFEGYAGVAEVALVQWEMSSGQPPEQRRNLAAQARRSCAALAQFARTFPLGQPRLLLWQGRVRWLEGRIEQAQRTWRHGLASAEQQAMPYEQALLWLEMGQRSLGTTRQQAQQTARQLLQQLGAQADLAGMKS